jgi:hypothetical protein
MLGKKEGYMIYMLGQESMGGNAGCWHGKPCLGANFFYDGNNGEIKYFGNWPSVPEEVMKKFISTEYLEGTFRVVLGGKIINLYLAEKTSDLAKQNLEETVKQYELIRRERFVRKARSYLVNE